MLRVSFSVNSFAKAHLGYCGTRSIKFIPANSIFRDFILEALQTSFLQLEKHSLILLTSCMCTGQFDTQYAFKELDLGLGKHTAWNINNHCLLILLFVQSCYWWVFISKEGGLLSQQGDTNKQNGSIITKKAFNNRANFPFCLITCSITVQHHWRAIMLLQPCQDASVKGMLVVSLDLHLVLLS